MLGAMLGERQSQHIKHNNLASRALSLSCSSALRTLTHVRQQQNTHDRPHTTSNASICIDQSSLRRRVCASVTSATADQPKGAESKREGERAVGKLHTAIHGKPGTIRRVCASNSRHQRRYVYIRVWRLLADVCLRKRLDSNGIAHSSCRDNHRRTALLIFELEISANCIR